MDIDKFIDTPSPNLSVKIKINRDNAAGGYDWYPPNLSRVNRRPHAETTRNSKQITKGCSGTLSDSNSVTHKGMEELDGQMQMMLKPKKLRLIGQLMAKPDKNLYMGAQQNGVAECIGEDLLV